MTALRARRPQEEPPPLGALAVLFGLLGLALIPAGPALSAFVSGVGCGVLVAWFTLRG